MAGQHRHVAPILWALAAVALVHLPVVLLVGERGWDDGAITIAFARTLAETGRFALTPVSPVVEGSSSLLFAALNALLHRVQDLSFAGALVASRGLTLVFGLVGCLLLLRQMEALGIARRSAATLAAGIFGLPAFAGTYEPVLLRGHVVWLRADHLARLAAPGSLDRRTIRQARDEGLLRAADRSDPPGMARGATITVLPDTVGAR